MYDKETIYDEKVSPLMKEIIEICKENNIEMVFSCFLREEDDMYCNTYIPSTETKNTKLIDIYNVLYNGYVVEKPFAMSMIITGD